MNKWVRSFLVALVVVLVLGTVVLAADASKQVGLVIQFPDNSVHTEIVTVPENATVADVLKAASVSVTIADTSWGPALCGIDDTGCGADNCFCDSEHYWAFFIQKDGAWTPASVGIGGYTPTDKEVVGFAWSGFDANYQPTVQPPYMTFEDILAQQSAPPAEIPEPATLLLVGGGVAALAGYVRRRRA